MEKFKNDQKHTRNDAKMREKVQKRIKKGAKKSGFLQKRHEEAPEERLKRADSVPGYRHPSDRPARR
jgi:hypothetical protein